MATSTTMLRVDPAQPPMEPEWAEAWLKLARVRLRGGSHQIAKSAAQCAYRLDASLQEHVEEILREAAAFDFKEVEVPSKGTLALELWPESAETSSDLTGGLVWSGGEQLASVLPLVRGLSGRRVLDLGSGTGVAGLAAALCGADVVLTDLPMAMPLLERNLARNLLEVQALGGSAVALPLDWRETVSPPHLLNCDVVLGCDLVWRADQCDPLVRWLANFCAPCLFPLTPRTRKHSVKEALETAWNAFDIEARPLDFNIGCEVMLLMAEPHRSLDVSWLTEAFQR